MSGWRSRWRIDGDVAGVADLLGQIGRVENELRLEERVLLGLGQEAEINADAEIFQAVVDEAGVAGLVAAHVFEQLDDVGVFAALSHLGVEHAAGEFSRQRADQEVDEFFAQAFRKLGQFECVPGLGAAEVHFVGVGPHFGDQGIPFGREQTIRRCWSISSKSVV